MTESPLHSVARSADGGSGLRERRALSVVGMSARALRCTSHPDRNALREQTVGLVRRDRRYGVAMIQSAEASAGRTDGEPQVHGAAVLAGADAGQRLRTGLNGLCGRCRCDYTSFGCLRRVFVSLNGLCGRCRCDDGIKLVTVR